MFVCVARVTLQIPESGSLKAKRQVVRRLTDRIKARFNVAVAEVEDNEVWNRATIALSVVSNQRRHATEQMDKIMQCIDDLYIAPVITREVETLGFGDQLFASAPEPDDGFASLTIPKGDRSLAEAEGMPDWDKQVEARASAPVPRASLSKKPKTPVSLESARATARRLRNPRDWEKGDS